MEEQANIRKAIVDEFVKILKAEPKISASAVTKLTELVSSGKKLKPEAFIEIFDAAEGPGD